MLCPVGRTRNLEHPTCRSCKIACQSPKKERRAVQSGPGGDGIWITTLDLTSPNAWTNKQQGRRIYQAVKREWQKALSGAEYYLGVANGLRQVEITRYVSSQRHRMDRDNMVASFKPLLDCLTALKIILDDNEDAIRLLDHPQQIGIPRVEIKITDIFD